MWELPPSISPANLGDHSHHTVYEAELVKIRLAVELALTHRTNLKLSFWFFIDNQPLISALTQPLETTPGLLLRKLALEVLKALTYLSPSTDVTLVWCPAHVGIQENEETNLEAILVANTGDHLTLPASLAVVKAKATNQSRLQAQSKIQT